MFAGCSVIVGVTVLVIGEVDRWPAWGSGFGSLDLTPLILMFTLRCWGLLLGVGVPAAVRTLRS